MSNVRISDKSSAASAASTDIFLLSNDPSGTNVDKKIAFSALEASLTVANQSDGAASGTGNIVRVTSATLVTPTLGVAAATSVNKITITTPATGATLTLIDGKTLTINKTMSFTASNDSGVYTLPTGTKTLLATDGAGTSLTGIPYSLTGTANQVVLSAATGNITFSTPQDIGTSSNPQFATIELGAASDTTIARVSAGVVSVEGKNVALNGTGETLTTGTIELGNASDTTLSRSAGGVLAVEGVVIPSISSTNTLTNKRITKRVTTAADATSITPNSDSADITYQANTQAGGTLTINADGGTPTDGQSWLLRVKCTNAQTFSWNAVYVGGTTALPTTTTGSSKIDMYSFIYSTVNSKWMYTGSALGFS